MHGDDFLILIPLILGPVSMGMIVLIVMVIARTKTRRTELQTEMQTKLIDKFSSAPEFLAFLNSEEGRRFLGHIESGPKLSARDRIIRGMGKALVTSLLGIGFLIIGFLPMTNNEFCVVVGFLLLFLGVGFLLSALLSLKLSRNWGLMEGEQTHANV